MECKGGINLYVCPKCHRGIATINLATGVTSVFVQCVKELGCGGGIAKSVNYEVIKTLQPTQILVVTYAWYRPKPTLLKRCDVERVMNGELLFAPLSVAVYRQLEDDPVAPHWDEVEFQMFFSTRYNGN